MTSFLIFLILLYLGIGVVLGAISGASVFMALCRDDWRYALLGAGIVMWVVVAWWGPIGMVWLWHKW